VLPAIYFQSRKMNKKQRFNTVRKMQTPDYMPVWPRVMSQMIYAMGWRLPDIIGRDWYDSEKCTEAVLWGLENIGYDVALPAYMDSAFGVTAIGGSINIPAQFGTSVGITNDKPVKSKNEWRRIRNKLAAMDVGQTEPRMKGVLKTINNVADSVGKATPLVTSGYLAATAAMLLFRPFEDFLNDMINDPYWVDEMCQVATDWTMDWIRAQYEAGANSVTFIVDTLGTLMISPDMGERFNLPYLYELVEMIRKEFDQGVWLHIHGNMKIPSDYAYLTKIIEETGVEGIHLDECHPPDWIIENVVNKFKIPACIVSDCHIIAAGPVQKIRQEVKNTLSKIKEGKGIMMATCCQILPQTPSEHFRTWVDATHEYGKYPLNPYLSAAC
jgi:uroporphyrinogen-III decarboxylase